jgi:hypothetical protein
MATWQTVSTPNTGTAIIYDMLGLGSGKFVAVGTGGTVLTSADHGLTWTARTAAAANDWTGLAYNGTTVVAVSNNGANRVMVSTDDGHTWTGKTAAEANDWTSVTYASFLGMFIAVSQSGVHRVMTSVNSGATWSTRTAASANLWCGIASSGSLVLAFSQDNQAMSSPDGINWTAKTAPTGSTAGGQGNGIISYLPSAGVFGVGGFTGTFHAVLMTTTDGTAWTYQTAAPLTGYFTLYSTIAANEIGGFVGSLPGDSAFNPTPTIIGISTDAGVTWTATNTTFSSTQWSSAAWDSTTKTVVFWDFAQTNTMLVGSFVSPTVVSVSPARGTIRGGTVVTVTGTDLGSVTSVLFGASAASGVVVASSTSLTCIAPAHAAGAVDVTVS